MNNDDTTAPQTTRRTPLVGCLTALGMAFTLALPHTAQAQIVTPPPVPPGLEVPATTVVVPKKLPELLRNNGEELLLAESFVGGVIIDYRSLEGQLWDDNLSLSLESQTPK